MYKNNRLIALVLVLVISVFTTVSCSHTSSAESTADILARQENSINRMLGEAGYSPTGFGLKRLFLAVLSQETTFVLTDQ